MANSIAEAESLLLINAYAQPLSTAKIVTLIVACAFVLIVVIASLRSSILRDQSRAAYRPFSLARTQMMWWTLVIGLAVILYCGAHGEAPAISGTCLILLGIGTGTTLTARMLDERQTVAAEGLQSSVRHQDDESKGFFEDILSDESGLSVHRFQAVIFNFIYGVTFLYSFAQSDQFPVYGAEALALLGISNAGYLGLKAFENGKPAAQARQGDELLDADVGATQLASG